MSLEGAQIDGNVRTDTAEGAERSETLSADSHLSFQQDHLVTKLNWLHPHWNRPAYSHGDGYSS